jgi:hypothetical protein
MKAERVIVKSSAPKHYWELRFLCKAIDERHEITIIKVPNEFVRTKEEILKTPGEFLRRVDAEKAKSRIWKALKGKAI